MLLGVRQAGHEVRVGFAAPVAVDAVYEGLPIAGRAARVDHHDDVAVRGEEFSVPPVRPRVAPCALRAAVNEQLRWVFDVRIIARGRNEEALDLGAVGGWKPEILHFGEIKLSEEGVV